MEFRGTTYKRYSLLFNVEENDPEASEESGEGDKQGAKRTDKGDETTGRRGKTKEEADEEAKAKAVKKWNWERLIWQLADRDITKVENILNTNYLLILNFLSMKKELGMDDIPIVKVANF